MFAGFFGFLWFRNPILHGYILITVASIAFIVCTLSYIMIYRQLRHHHNKQTDEAQVQTQQQAANPLNVATYRRSASNMLWIYGLFVLCYLPSVLTKIAIRVVGHTVIIRCITEFAVVQSSFSTRV